jgi:hypothetical protein
MVIELIPNGSFERGWTDLLPYGSLINQQSRGFYTYIRTIGTKLLSTGFTPDENPRYETVAVIPEWINKHADQLPPDERLGGEGALILDGEWTNKLFAAGGAFSADLGIVVVVPMSGTVDIDVPVAVHAHGDPSPGAAVWRLVVNDTATPWLTFRGGFEDREWHTEHYSLHAAAGDVLTVVRQCESRALGGIDFFSDNWRIWLTPDPDTDAEPEPDDEPGVDYVVNVNLVPQDATLAEIGAVNALVHDSRETVLQSHDDALRLVRGGLPGSRLTVWDPGRWGGAAFMEYLAQQWPGGLIETAEIPTNGSGETDPEEPEPEPTPEPGETWEPTSFIPTGTKLGWHAIGNCGLPQLYVDLPSAPTIKLVQAVSDIATMPACYPIIRLIDCQKYGNIEWFNYDGDPEAQAEARIDILSQLLAPYAGQTWWTEPINEQDIRDADHAPAVARFAIRCMEVAPSWMRLAHFSFGPGNPSDLAFWSPIAETGVFEKIAERGDIIALHAYYDHRVPSDLEWLLLRHRYLYNNHILPRHLDIPLVLSECGPWEHLLKESAFDLQEWCRVTDAYLAQDPYVVGANLYTVSDVAGWATFNTAFKALYPWFKQYVASVAGRANG